MSSEDHDDVPPLEDMSDYLQQLKTKQSSLDHQLPSKKPAEKKHVTTVDSSLLQLENEAMQPPKNLLICEETTSTAASSKSNHSPKQDSSKAKHSTTSEPQSSANTKSKSTSSTAFGGMKKGFLFGGGSKAQRKTASTSSKTAQGGSSSRATPGVSAGNKEEEVPFLKAQQQEKQAGMRLDEVQEEMKKAYPLLQTQDWISDDLLGKISQNPVLSNAFQDPALLQTLQQFHQNPQETMARAQHNPQMRAFLQEFCSLMGNHFTALADKGDKVKERDASQISETTSSEQNEMNDLLSIPVVREALSDPNIQTLIQLLRTEPEKAQRFLQDKPSEFHERVKILVDNGLLALQRK